MKAFILGAGLGTRLRPLTDVRPKPLVPLYHRPMVEWAMEACQRVGVSEMAVNTHHLSAEWRMLGPEMDARGERGGNGEWVKRRVWQGMELSFFDEPELLETGGGLKNIEEWLAGESVLVHNGDIFSTMDLGALVARHRESGMLATLLLRSEGLEKRVSVNAEGDRVTDLRSQLLGVAGTHVFTGIYCMEAEVLKRVPAGEKVQIIPALLELAKEGRLGAWVSDEGEWRDLGDVESYLAAHRELGLAERVHEESVVEDGAVVERSVIGPGVRVGAGARVVDSVVWPGVVIEPGAVVEGKVVYRNGCEC